MRLLLNVSEFSFNILYDALKQNKNHDIIYTINHSSGKNLTSIVLFREIAEIKSWKQIECMTNSSSYANIMQILMQIPIRLGQSTRYQ